MITTLGAPFGAVTLKGTGGFVFLVLNSEYVAGSGGTIGSVSRLKISCAFVAIRPKNTVKITNAIFLLLKLEFIIIDFDS